ncbi:HAT domain-containing protein [Ilyonectria robusta]
MVVLTITRFFSRSSNRSESDNVVLAPESINNSRDLDALIQPDKFKLQGEQYTRCSVLARGSKLIKKCMSVIWLYNKQQRCRRLRYFGHIINLCAQAFLIGKDAEKVCKDLDAVYREGDMKRIRELWRKHGAIRRLHNIIKYIRASPQHYQFFRLIICRGELSEFNSLEPDLVRIALDILAVPSISDECKQLFSSTKILLFNRRLRLKIDIIKASEYLRSWFGPPARNTFKDINIRRLEGESDLQGTRQVGEGSEIRMSNEDLQTVDQDSFLDEDNTAQEGLR